MIILVCGSRTWTDFDTIAKFLDEHLGDTIVEGDCRGADKIVGYLARKRGMKVIAEPAKWTRFGDFAGPIRNAFMIHMYEPELVVAFHDDIKNSRGTKGMLHFAKKCGIPSMIIKSKSTI